MKTLVIAPSGISITYFNILFTFKNNSIFFKYIGFITKLYTVVRLQFWTNSVVTYKCYVCDGLSLDLVG